MEQTLQEKLDKLLNAYSHHYEIQRNVAVDGVTYPALAAYFLRDENYLLSKKHVLSVVENFEYVYFLLAERLDADTLRRHIEITTKDGLSKIKPGPDHMSSFVSLVILADTIDPEAQALLRKTRLRKNFRLALHGWMEYHIAAMECSTQSFLSNPAGKEARRTLELNFGSKSK